MATTKLRAVAPGEAPPKKKPTSITEATQTGTTREQLECLRDRVAKALDDVNCPVRELASLSKRLMEITKEIEAIDVKAAEESHGAAATPDEEWQAV